MTADLGERDQTTNMPHIEVGECGGQQVVYLNGEWWWGQPHKGLAESLARLLTETLAQFGGSAPSGTYPTYISSSPASPEARSPETPDATRQDRRIARDKIVTNLTTLIDEAAEAHSVNNPLPYSEIWFRAEEIVKALQSRQED